MEGFGSLIARKSVDKFHYLPFNRLSTLWPFRGDVDVDMMIHLLIFDGIVYEPNQLHKCLSKFFTDTEINEKIRNIQKFCAVKITIRLANLHEFCFHLRKINIRYMVLNQEMSQYLSMLSQYISSSIDNFKLIYKELINDHMFFPCKISEKIIKSITTIFTNDEDYDFIVTLWNYIISQYTRGLMSYFRGDNHKNAYIFSRLTYLFDIFLSRRYVLIGELLIQTIRNIFGQVDELVNCDLCHSKNSRYQKFLLDEWLKHFKTLLHDFFVRLKDLPNINYVEIVRIVNDIYVKFDYGLIERAVTSHISQDIKNLYEIPLKYILMIENYPSLWILVNYFTNNLDHIGQIFYDTIDFSFYFNEQGKFRNPNPSEFPFMNDLHIQIFDYTPRLFVNLYQYLLQMNTSDIYKQYNQDDKFIPIFDIHERLKLVIKRYSLEHNKTGRDIWTSLLTFRLHSLIVTTQYISKMYTRNGQYLNAVMALLQISSVVNLDLFFVQFLIFQSHIFDQSLTFDDFYTLFFNKTEFTLLVSSISDSTQLSYISNLIVLIIQISRIPLNYQDIPSDIIPIVLTLIVDGCLKQISCCRRLLLSRSYLSKQYQHCFEELYPQIVTMTPDQNFSNKSSSNANPIYQTRINPNYKQHYIIHNSEVVFYRQQQSNNLDNVVFSIHLLENKYVIDIFSNIYNFLVSSVLVDNIKNVLTSKFVENNSLSFNLLVLMTRGYEINHENLSKCTIYQVLHDYFSANSPVNHNELVMKMYKLHNLYVEKERKKSTQKHTSRKYEDMKKKNAAISANKLILEYTSVCIKCQLPIMDESEKVFPLFRGPSLLIRSKLVDGKSAHYNLCDHPLHQSCSQPIEANKFYKCYYCSRISNVIYHSSLLTRSTQNISEWITLDLTNNIVKILDINNFLPLSLDNSPWTVPMPVNKYDISKQINILDISNTLHCITIKGQNYSAVLPFVSLLSMSQSYTRNIRTVPEDIINSLVYNIFLCKNMTEVALIAIRYIIIHLFTVQIGNNDITYNPCPIQNLSVYKQYYSLIQLFELNHYNIKTTINTDTLRIASFIVHILANPNNPYEYVFMNTILKFFHVDIILTAILQDEKLLSMFLTTINKCLTDVKYHIGTKLPNLHKLPEIFQVFRNRILNELKQMKSMCYRNDSVANIAYCLLCGKNLCLLPCCYKDNKKSQVTNHLAEQHNQLGILFLFSTNFIILVQGSCYIEYLQPYRSESGETSTANFKFLRLTLDQERMKKVEDVYLSQSIIPEYFRHSNHFVLEKFQISPVDSNNI